MPIAATITLRSGDTAWYWKTAYDERLSRYAPGMLLTAALTEELAEDSAIVRTNSAAAPDNSVLDDIWRERLTLCDRLIAVRPEAPFARGRAAGKIARPGSCGGQIRSGAVARDRFDFRAPFPA